MSVIKILMEMPWWYVLVILIFSTYYAIRGLMSYFTKNNSEKYKEWTKSQRIIILYLQEIIFKVIITVSSFSALYVANNILLNIKSFNDIGIGLAGLLIFLFVWGIIGVCGYLTLFISMGKIPGTK